MNDNPTTAPGDVGIIASPENGNGNSTSPVESPSSPAIPAPRKRGRHKTDCACPVCRQKRGEKSGGQNRVENRSALDAPVFFDADLVKEFADCLLSIADDYQERKTRALAVRLTDDKTVINEFVEISKLKGEERARIVTIAGKLAEKYKVTGEYMLEIMLACNVGAWIYRGWRTESQLVALIRQRQDVPEKSKNEVGAQKP
jgi:hypothetical protein